MRTLILTLLSLSLGCLSHATPVQTSVLLVNDRPSCPPSTYQVALTICADFNRCEVALLPVEPVLPRPVNAVVPATVSPLTVRETSPWLYRARDSI
jgi:hypothetical protein